MPTVKTVPDTAPVISSSRFEIATNNELQNAIWREELSKRLSNPEHPYYYSLTTYNDFIGTDSSLETLAVLSDSVCRDLEQAVAEMIAIDEDPDSTAQVYNLPYVIRYLDQFTKSAQEFEFEKINDLLGEIEFAKGEQRAQLEAQLGLIFLDFAVQQKLENYHHSEDTPTTTPNIEKRRKLWRFKSLGLTTFLLAALASCAKAHTEPVETAATPIAIVTPQETTALPTQEAPIVIATSTHMPEEIDDILDGYTFETPQIGQSKPLSVGDLIAFNTYGQLNGIPEAIYHTLSPDDIKLLATYGIESVIPNSSEVGIFANGQNGKGVIILHNGEMMFYTVKHVADGGNNVSNSTEVAIIVNGIVYTVEPDWQIISNNYPEPVVRMPLPASLPADTAYSEFATVVSSELHVNSQNGSLSGEILQLPQGWLVIKTEGSLSNGDSGLPIYDKEGKVLAFISTAILSFKDQSDQSIRAEFNDLNNPITSIERLTIDGTTDTGDAVVTHGVTLTFADGTQKRLIDPEYVTLIDKYLELNSGTNENGERFTNIALVAR